MFPDLFTNIWCSFLDGVQAQIQPHASATSCPPPSPPSAPAPGGAAGMGRAGERRGGNWAVVSISSQGCSEGQGDRPEALVARHGPRWVGRRARTGSACPAPRATPARARPVPNGKEIGSYNCVFMMGCLQLSQAGGEGWEARPVPKGQRGARGCRNPPTRAGCAGSAIPSTAWTTFSMPAALC